MAAALVCTYQYKNPMSVWHCSRKWHQALAGSQDVPTSVNAFSQIPHTSNLCLKQKRATNTSEIFLAVRKQTEPLFTYDVESEVVTAAHKGHSISSTTIIYAIVIWAGTLESQRPLLVAD